MVHKHAASRLHFDLRLEMGGVLQSWAVPKGPSFDSHEKRLAVKVEEHPIEYADFEGVIPRGNYGAGAMIVWDRGRWEPVGDPIAGLEKGKLLFDLIGYKLRGRWTLFRTRRGEKEWLLVKKPDAFAGSPPPAEESILSNLTVEELGMGSDPSKKLVGRLRRLKAPRQAVDPSAVEPMLAEIGARPFSRAGWIFELKYDGYRLIGGKVDGRAILRYRRGQDVTERFPELATALSRLPLTRVTLDGEMVCMDERGMPSFGRLQRRVHLKRRRDVDRAAVTMPVTFMVFDLVGVEDYDLRSLPLSRRKELLKGLLPRAGPLRYSDHIERAGEEMYREITRMGLEGMIAKKADSPYRPGRSPEWLKFRAERTDDFVVVGFTSPRGSRVGFGALHLGVHDSGDLVYVGRVGTGFDTGTIHEVEKTLAPIVRPDPPFHGPPPAGAGHTWVEPMLVCEVRYKEWTDAGQLRHPVFARLREDKAPEDCVRPSHGEVLGEGSDDDAMGTPLESNETAPEPSLTNLEKVFWPEEGYTKGDLIDFYRRISPWLLPYLANRPVVLTRYPDGIKGKSFFQKDAPGFVPDWIRTERMWSEHAQREIHYFICDNVQTLTYLANLGTIPLHLWSSRLSSLQAPDWCILDLDPKEAPFEHVVRIARSIRDLCEVMGIDSFVKTSGSTGLHILLPLGGQCSFEQSRQLAQLIARIVAAELPEIATTARARAARNNRVYIDALQNGHGKLLVSPFSVRPLPGAPVSTPLRWTEVRKGLDIGRYTIRTVPRRLDRMGEDPLRGVLHTVPDLHAALERLAERVTAVEPSEPG